MDVDEWNLKFRASMKDTRGKLDVVLPLPLMPPLPHPLGLLKSVSCNGVI